MKVPCVGYVPGVAVMEGQYSLTSSAIVFHINLGKEQLEHFLIVELYDIMLYRIVMGFLMNLHHKLFSCHLWVLNVI